MIIKKKLTSILFLMFLSASLSACIILPLKWDNPAKDKTKGVVVSETTKDELHELLGPPIISNNKDNVEVFRFYGGELKIFWASMFTAPIAWPTPWAGVETDDMTGYILVVYDSDIVKEVKYGSDQWGSKIKLTDFFFNISSEELLSAKKYSDEFKNYNKIVGHCTVYIVPNREFYIQRFDLDGRLVGVYSREGYLKKHLSPGHHNLVVSYMTERKYREHIDSQLKSFELMEFILEEKNVNFSCSSKDNVFFEFRYSDTVLIDGEYKDLHILEMKNQAPEKIYEKHRIVSQIFQPWTNYTNP